LSWRSSPIFYTTLRALKLKGRPSPGFYRVAEEKTRPGWILVNAWDQFPARAYVDFGRKGMPMAFLVLLAAGVFAVPRQTRIIKKLEGQPLKPCSAGAWCPLGSVGSLASAFCCSGAMPGSSIATWHASTCRPRAMPAL